MLRVRHELFACGNVDMVIGTEFESAMPALSMLFDACDKRHLHCHPLSTLAIPCPSAWLTDSASSVR